MMAYGNEHIVGPQEVITFYLFSGSCFCKPDKARGDLEGLPSAGPGPATIVPKGLAKQRLHPAGNQRSHDSAEWAELEPRDVCVLVHQPSHMEVGWLPHSPTHVICQVSGLGPPPFSETLKWADLRACFGRLL